jgi:hypothetical protein
MRIKVSIVKEIEVSNDMYFMILGARHEFEPKEKEERWEL